MLLGAPAAWAMLVWPVVKEILTVWEGEEAPTIRRNLC